MSETSLTMDINTIFPMISQCGCNANVRMTLVGPHSPSDGRHTCRQAVSDVLI